MKLVGTLPCSPRSFDRMLQQLCRQPAAARDRLFRTAQAKGFFTDGTLLTRMSIKERQLVDKHHWDLMVTDAGYVDAKPFPLKLVLPEIIGTKVLAARHVGGSEDRQVVRLENGEARVYAEAEAFAALNARHPFACWRMTCGKDWWRSPVVLLSKEGFCTGELLGALATVAFRSSEDSEDQPESKRQFRRNRLDGVWRYDETTNEEIR